MTVMMVPNSMCKAEGLDHFVVFATNIDPKGYSEGCCWPHHSPAAALATTTSVPDNLRLMPIIPWVLPS